MHRSLLRGWIHLVSHEGTKEFLIVICGPVRFLGEEVDECPRKGYRYLSKVIYANAKLIFWGHVL